MISSIIETLRTIHHGMTKEDAQLLRCNIIFDPKIIGEKKIEPTPGNRVSAWQAEVQYQMGFSGKTLEQARHAIQEEAEKRLEPYSFRLPLSRRKQD